MDTKNLETKIDALKTSIDILVRAEFVRCGATR